MRKAALIRSAIGEAGSQLRRCRGGIVAIGFVTVAIAVVGDVVIVVEFEARHSIAQQTVR